MKSSRPQSKSGAGIQIYRRLLIYVKPYWGLFAISMLGFSIYSGTQSLFAVLIKQIVDTLQTEAREGMQFLPLFFSGLIIVHGIGTYLGNYFLAKVSTNVVHALRCEIFDKYTQLPTAFLMTIIAVIWSPESLTMLAKWPRPVPMPCVLLPGKA